LPQDREFALWDFVTISSEYLQPTYIAVAKYLVVRLFIFLIRTPSCPSRLLWSVMSAQIAPPGAIGLGDVNTVSLS
jgi:hypothetical protein